MTAAGFDPPGGVGELDAEAQERWSQQVSGLIADAVAGNPSEHDGPRAQFFDPTVVDVGPDAADRQVFWFAFPRTVKTTPGLTDREKWERADADRGTQDEYCEWAVTRNDEGKIVRATFTSEVPEYFELLAETDPGKLLDLYHELLSPEVELDDLLDGGVYDKANKWNTRTDIGPAHLMEGSNTLGAAVELAAAATIPRKIDGVFKTEEQDLIACSRYGVPTRNSDPHIGAQINELARADADICLANPPGLYLIPPSTGGWQTPDGTDAKEFWTFTRGGEGQRVRAVYEVTGDHTYVVGDIKIGGQPIEFGGQIADRVSVSIKATACRIGQSQGEPFTSCRG
jgi:hypothetical protein